MEIINNPTKTQWTHLTERPRIDTVSLQDTVGDILSDIVSRRDVAVREYVERFQGIRLHSFAVSEEEFSDAEREVSEPLKTAILKAKDNIAKFHASQKQTINKIETTDGVVCWQKSIAIEKVGLYIPGGTAPLFSTVLMLAVPAQIAGCKEIIICSPCG
ncbi:MAG: histidinol dehydrogenase, partial [Bacteroidales bacterium]